MTPTLRLLCLILFPLGSLSTVFAGSGDEARQWIEKLSVLYANPFHADFKMKLGDGSQGDIGGTLDFGSDQKMRMDMQMKMDQGGQTLDIKMLIVSDGKDIWMDMNMPAMGMRQVMTVSLEKAKQAAGMNQALSMLGQDPATQVKKLAETLDFKVTQKAGGKVTLTAHPTKEQLAELTDKANQLPADIPMSKIVFQMDEKSVMPMTMMMGDDTSTFLEMSFENYRKLTDSEMAKSFSYTPPEGVQVMNMNEMLGAGQ